MLRIFGGSGLPSQIKRGIRLGQTLGRYAGTLTGIKENQVGADPRGFGGQPCCPLVNTGRSLKKGGLWSSVAPSQIQNKYPHRYKGKSGWGRPSESWEGNKTKWKTKMKK